MVTKSKKKINKEPFYNIVIPAIIVFLSSLLFMPSSGVFRTIPVLLVCGVVVGIMGMGKTVAVVCAGIFNLCTYLVHGNGVIQSLLFAILAVAFVAGGAYIGLLVKTSLKTSKESVKQKCYILMSVTFVFAVALSCLFCGNIYTFLKYSKSNNAYINEHYGKTIEKNYTAYEWREMDVRTYVTFKHDAVVIGADNECYISTKEDKVTDNVRDYYENLMLKEANKKLAGIMAGVTSAFEISASDVDLDNGEILSATSNVGDYSKRVAYAVSFYSLIDDKADFEVLCCDAVAAVKAYGFEYEEIVFCAGDPGNVKYSFVMNDETNVKNVSSGIKQYSDEDVARFGIDEKTILSYWQ
ncbi:MAG: hypothetical protein E7600_04040 [Ruminococcaceae bacterium]|nr:hypothetical protein [Oscillospiraceae bacterium]